MRERDREIDSVIKLLEDDMEKNIKEEKSATKLAIVVYSVGFLGLLLFFLFG